MLHFWFNCLSACIPTHQSFFLQLNPQHTVPTLKDGDFAIWDSHAISAYLVDKYGKDDSLYPKDLQKRAVVDQRLHFDSGVVFPRLSAIVVSKLILHLRNSSSHVSLCFHFVLNVFMYLCITTNYPWLIFVLHMIHNFINMVWKKHWL